MLVVQCLVIFVAAPCVTIGYPGSGLGFEMLLLVFAVLIIVVSRGRTATTIAALSMLASVTGIVLTTFTPSTSTHLLGHLGTMGGGLVVTYTVGCAVFGPGVVTMHRVFGAIVLYLNFGILCATGYRVIWDLFPNSLMGISAGMDSREISGTIVYFSFVTLTTIGYGDVVPVHPFARGLASLEGVIGQLYPATLIARLITLQIETRRR